MLLLSVRAVRALMELHAQDTVVAMEVQSVMPKHLGNQRVLDLQTLTHGETRPRALRDGEIPYITRTQSQSEISSLPSAGAPSPPVSPVSHPPVVCLRVEVGPGAGRHCCTAESAGFVEVCVRGCEAELLTSTINTLGPFMEDELNSDVQPIRITVHNTRITLKVRGRSCWSSKGVCVRALGKWFICSLSGKVLSILLLGNRETWPPR